MEQEKQLKGLATVWPEEEGQAPQTVYFQPPKKKKYPVEWLNLWQNVDTGSQYDRTSRNGKSR